MAITIVGNAFVSTSSGFASSGGGSLAIENCKGHIHVFSDSGAGAGGRSSGFYSLDPPIPEAAGSRALILGIPLNFQEIVQPTVTLDDKRTLYVFGTAWNSVSVSGLLLLGDASTRGAQLTSLVTWYNANRVSVKKGPVKVSLGTTGIEAYVIGLGLSDANPKVNTQSFTINLLTAEVK